MNVTTYRKPLISTYFTSKGTSYEIESNFCIKVIHSFFITKTSTELINMRKYIYLCLSFFCIKYYQNVKNNWEVPDKDSTRNLQHTYTRYEKHDAILACRFKHFCTVPCVHIPQAKSKYV